MRKIVLIRLMTCLSLLISLSVSAQTAQLRNFVRNIYNFNAMFPQEKVYLQLDNTGYFQGETIWYKAYIVNASTLKKSTSGVLYVELVSPSGVVLQQQKQKIIYGQCDGAFDLVDMATRQAREMRGAVSYPSGYYEIRAYTLNMLNFSEDALFSRVVPVFKKPTKDGAYYDEAPIFKETKSDIEQFRPKTGNLKNFNVTFYPEGGELVLGVPCRVAFKVTDNAGMGVSAQGILNYDRENLQISTLHDGMGSFTFTPTQKSNSVRFIYSDSEYNFDLPAAVQLGYSMFVENDCAGNIDVTIQGTLEEPKDSLGLTMICRGELLYFKTIACKRDRQTVSIQASTWPAGVCQLTLFTPEGQILARRYVFNRVNVKTPSLTFETDKANYAPFEKVGMKFYLTDADGVPFVDRFCVSVRDSRSFGTNYSENLKTNMLLCSDLRGYINNPDYYFSSDDSQHHEALDLLMMIQGWERYDWQTMAAGTDNFHEKHRVEEGLTYNGWILKKRGTGVVSGVKVLAAVVPENKSHVDQFEFATDKNGYFGFDLTEFYGDATLTMEIKKMNSDKLSNAKILLERSMKPSARAFRNEELLFNLSNVDKQKEDLSKMDLDRTSDPDLPTVINEDMGILLDDVYINAKRKYIDYNTFKAYDVVKDTEEEYDQGNYTTNVYGYLMSKGYPIWKNDSIEGSSSSGNSSQRSDEIAAEHIDVNSGETAQSILYSSNLWRMGNARLIWYVHDSKRCIYQGIFEDPWTIDMDYIKSIIVYDKPVPASNVFSLTPLLISNFSRDASETLSAFMTSFASSGLNYCVVDVLLKENHEMKSKSELLSLNKRITTVQGYSNLRDFYGPSYPDGPILGDVDYRRTLYWNPDVISNKNGEANIEFYNNSQSGTFTVTGCGMTASGTAYVIDSDF